MEQEEETLDAEANALLQRFGFLVLATYEEPELGQVVSGFGRFDHPVVIVGIATREEYEAQHGKCPPNPWPIPRKFIKVTAE